MMPDAHVEAQGRACVPPSPPLDARSREQRRMAVEGLAGGGRGHLGSALSVIEILRVLYDDIMRTRPADPGGEGRDRLIFSKGHGCLALYALLADKGFIPRRELATFCRRDSLLGGHPEASKIPGVEASTGALGHGLPIGVGRALALKMADSKARVFVVMGDGEINEGSVWEAAMCAGKHGLDNLVAIVDYNKHQSYAATRVVQDLEPLLDKWQAFGFAARETDGHDPAALRRAFEAAPFAPGRPGVLVCHTVKGKGVSFAENNLAWHHKSKISPEELDALLAELEG